MRRSRLQKEKRIFSKVLSRLTPFLAILILILSYHLFANRLGVFNVSNISVTGTKTFVNETDVREIVRARTYGQNILGLDVQDLERTISSSFQGAKSITVRRKLPNTLQVEVLERIPIAIVSNPDENDEFLVDEDGYVLGYIAPETSNFPRILYDGEIEVGYFLNARALSVYFELLKALDSEGVAVSSASAGSNHLSVWLRSSVEVLIGLKEDTTYTAKVLAQLLKQLTTEGKKATRVDLRYDKVVVSYD